VAFVDRLAGETCGRDACEVGALNDVLVSTAQRALDGLSGGLGFGDLPVDPG